MKYLLLSLILLAGFFSGGCAETILRNAPVPPTPEAVATAFYQQHAKNEHGLYWRRRWLSRDFYAAIAKEYSQTRAEYRNKQPVHLNFDPFTGEPGLPNTVRVVGSEVHSSTASVELEMSWGKGPNVRTSVVVVKFQRHWRGWLICDVVTSEGSVSGFLMLNDK